MLRYLLIAGLIANLSCIAGPEPNLEKEEYEILVQNANSGDADAQFTLFKLHRDGADVPISDTEAREWFQKALASGHRYAKQIDSANHIGAALIWIGDDAKQKENLVEFHYVNGLVHYSGTDTFIRDIPIALRYFEFCAKHGHLRSNFVLALVYGDVESIHYDPIASEGHATKFYESASLDDLKYSSRQAIGHEYLPRNVELGARSLSAAGERFKDGESYYFLAALYTGQLPGASKTLDFQRALKYAELAAHLNYEPAFAVAGVLMTSFGDDEQKKAGHKMLIKAANTGHSESQLILARAYFLGNSFAEQDLIEAYKWTNILLAHTPAEGQESLRELRASLLEAMSPEQIAEGKKLSHAWLSERKLNW